MRVQRLVQQVLFRGQEPERVPGQRAERQSVQRERLPVWEQFQGPGLQPEQERLLVRVQRAGRQPVQRRQFRQRLERQPVRRGRLPVRVQRAERQPVQQERPGLQRVQVLLQEQ